MPIISYTSVYLVYTVVLLKTDRFLIEVLYVFFAQNCPSHVLFTCTSSLIHSTLFVHMASDTHSLPSFRHGVLNYRLQIY